MPQYYRRKAYEEMLRWKREYAPQYALSLRGARRVGKTTLAEKLGREQYRSYIYLMDTGLLVSFAYRDRPYLENELYKAILLDKLHVNEGMIVENATAQALRASGHRAFFYREADKKTRRTVMEVDFLVRRGNKACPVEVRLSTGKSTKSLVRFKEKFGKRVGQGYVLHAGEVKREGGIVYLPYYLAPFL